jgi:hypothetical protein
VTHAFRAGQVSRLGLGALMTACSTASAPAASDGGREGAALGDASLEADVATDAGDESAEGSPCACTAGGACDSFGCPPEYDDAAAFAAWCATVQAGALGHDVTMRTCGSLLVMTYDVEGGCERGYVVGQPAGQLVATVDECQGATLGCALLEPSACVPGSCLLTSGSLGIPSLCPAWQPDAGDAGGE